MKTFADYILENHGVKDFKTPTRVWINCPSTLQPYHKYHGTVGIAHTNDKGETALYFTEGSVSSMLVDPLYLETKNSQENILKYDK